MGYEGFSYRIPLVRGLTDNANQTQRSPSDLEIAKNITLHENNVQRDFGEANISALLSGIPRVGMDYFPIPTSQKTVIFTSDGVFQKADDQGAGLWTSLKTGLNGTQVAQLALCGQELAARDRRLILFNGYDYPQVLTANGSSTERIGFLTSLTNKLNTDIGGGSGYPASAVMVEYTTHGLRTGDTISLVGFSNVGSINPNKETISIVKIDDNKFYYFPTLNPTTTESNGGGTGKIYCHPADWNSTVQPLGAVVHEKRLVAYLRHTLYISQILDHTQFEKGDTYDLPVDTGLGNEIKGVSSLYGRLICFKYPSGIVQIISPTSNFPEIKVLSTALGCPGQNAFKEVEGDIIFISQFGSVHSLLAVDSVDEIKSSSITGRFYLDRYLRQQINFSKISRAVVEYDATNRVVWCAYPKIGSNENNLVVKIDVNEPGNPKCSITERKTYVSLWKQQDTTGQFRLVAGTEDRYIRNLNSSVRLNADGSPFESVWRTSFTDFSDQYPEVGRLNKQCDFLEFVLEPDNTDVDMLINVYVDGTTRDTFPVSFQTTVPSFPITFPVVFNSELPRNFSFPLRSVYGRRIATEFVINSANQNYKISDIIYSFKAGDERSLS